ncbi:hypothetical protein CHH57_01835 [Niallia circulans]|uniref:Uncharacterized protein n=1 Tax=Niallia circulans TaxID=1397 RepID=A0AA91Z2H7_NIACI|nr:hypothetical protein [Niallia circulans]PAD84938.1 hypothetical protein CHH57_01835 [Niallia circulans]
MKAIVVFSIGESEIKSNGIVPVNLEPGVGRDNMTINNAIKQFKKDTGIDLYEIDEKIRERAKVIY